MSGSSRSSSESTSDAPLRFYIDSRLGAVAIPQMVRRLGYEAFHKEDVFGRRKVEDVEWIEHASSAGWVALTKDDRIRRRPLEKQRFSASTLRVFCLANGNLLKVQQVEYFETNWSRIIAACDQPGPFLYAVHKSAIEPMKLY